MTIIWRILAPLIVPILLLFARETNVKTNHYGQPQVKRYRLPRWAAFAETPDEHLPGGLYEPTQLKIYERFGWFIASWYWLAWRNVGHRMRWDKGFAVPSNIRQLSAEEQAKYGIWKTRETYGPFVLIRGYQVKNDWFGEYSDNGLWAVPQLTIRLASQDWRR